MLLQSFTAAISGLIPGWVVILMFCGIFATGVCFALRR
jgi:hypothetical protein